MTKPTFSLNFDLLGALDVLTCLGRTLADIWHSLGSSLPILTVFDCSISSYYHLISFSIMFYSLQAKFNRSPGWPRRRARSPRAPCGPREIICALQSSIEWRDHVG